MKAQHKLEQHNMETMSSCMAQLRKKGYSEDFTIDTKGITPVGLKKHYKPWQICIENFYRFEGDSDPADSSILYAVETDDGLRGLISDSYGPQADSLTSSFMQRVDDFHKRSKYTSSGEEFLPPIYD